MHRFTEYGPLVIVILLAVNVLFLNIFIITRLKPVEKQEISTVATPAGTVCDESCRKAITTRVLESLPTQQATPAESVQTTGDQVREYIIPLGGGSTSSTTYTDMSGVEAYIDTANYPSIQKVVFEVYLTIPIANGFAYAKLFNVTDKHDVWFSEVSMETNQVIRKEATIQLVPGKKLYRVMMKSTMAAEAKLINARIRILAK
jgi:hypothetical protein